MREREQERNGSIRAQKQSEQTDARPGSPCAFGWRHHATANATGDTRVAAEPGFMNEVSKKSHTVRRHVVLPLISSVDRP